MRLSRNRNLRHQSCILKGNVECVVVDCTYVCTQPRENARIEAEKGPRLANKSRYYPTNCRSEAHGAPPLCKATTFRLYRMLLQPLHLQVCVTCMMPSRPRDRPCPQTATFLFPHALVFDHSNLTGARVCAQLNTALGVLIPEIYFKATSLEDIL
jgi:hypothetical protein